MGVILNVDYEQALFTDNTNLVSNAINQELEYLLFWIQDEPVYTLKKYGANYLDFVRQHSKFEPQITRDKINLIPWWGKLDDLNFERKMNSKVTAFEIAEKFNLNHPEFQLMRMNQCRDNYYYKMPLAMSGRGVLKGQISKGVDYRDVIEMPLLERIIDFSYLKFDNALPGIVYQNIVDHKFQYKGTIIGESMSSELVSEYKKLIAPVEEYLIQQGAQAVWCIDSFLYRENKETKILAISEINYRKTMGYVTYLFSQLYGKDYKFTQLILSRNEIQNSKLLKLSPKGNRFYTYLLHANYKSDLII